MRVPRIVGAPEQIVTGASSVQSSAWDTIAGGSGATVAMLTCTVACRYRVGEDPAAVAADTLLMPNQTHFVEVAIGERIAAIQEAAAGKLSISAVHFRAG